MPPEQMNRWTCDAIVALVTGRKNGYWIDALIGVAALGAGVGCLLLSRVTQSKILFLVLAWGWFFRCAWTMGMAIQPSDWFDPAKVTARRPGAEADQPVKHLV